MSKKLMLFLSFTMSISICSIAFAQHPPNGGYESWSGGNPTDWWTSNSIGLVNVTQSTDAHSGNFSARLEVLDFGGFGVPAFLYSGDFGQGFPCNQRHASVTGYYKFMPQNPTDIMSIFAQIWQGDNLLGAGAMSITDAATNWTQFNVPIDYFETGTPDTCYVDILVGSETGFGAFGYVDDVELTSATAIEELDNGLIPSQFELKQNYPNPFNPTTNIEFTVPQSSNVRLIIYNQLGQEVMTLVNKQLPAGSYKVEWNAVNMPNGLYFYRIYAGDFVGTRKMILMK
jgi:hypothetical protein